jgi:cytochrome c-type biogenesis protein CcmF
VDADGARGTVGARGAPGRLPRADWGKAVAHGGLGVTIFAVSAMLAWKTEDIRVVQIGGSYPLGPMR